MKSGIDDNLLLDDLIRHARTRNDVRTRNAVGEDRCICFLTGEQITIISHFFYYFVILC